jgi:glycosyltransferase involved in cell wall biosynthesis
MPLVLAGAGPKVLAVEGWARDRKVVTYLGLRTRTECEALTARAAAVVAPSAWLEPLGTVAISAMAAGVPTVASGHGSFVELVRDGKTGILYRSGDVDGLANAMVRVASDVEGNLRMGRAARQHYELDFTPEVGLKALVDVYRSVIAEAKTGACRELIGHRPGDSMRRTSSL